MIRQVRRAFRFLTKRQRSIFVLLTFGRSIVHILDVVGLAAIGIVGAALATAGTNSEPSRLFGFSLDLDSVPQMVGALAAVVGFFLSKSTLSAALLWATAHFLARVEATAAQKIANYILLGDLERLSKYSRAEASWAISTSSYVAFSSILFSASTVVTEASLFIFLFATFLFIDLETAIFLGLFFGLLISLFHYLINHKAKNLGLRLTDNSLRMGQSVLNLYDTFRELTVLGERSFFLEKFSGYRRAYSRDQGLHRFLVGSPRFFVEAGLLVGILALFAWQLPSREPAELLPIIGIFALGGFRMMAALLPLQTAVLDLKTYAPQAERAFAVMDLAQKLDQGGAAANQRRASVSKFEKRSARDGSRSGVRVSLKSLGFRYPKGQTPALDNISIEIDKGEFIAIIGPSGAGKSTFADIVLGLYTPTAGEVLINGKPPKELIEEEPGLIAYVPQRPGLISGTIFENIAIGKEQTPGNIRKAMRALKVAQLDRFVESLPLGLESNLGKNNEALSGGQAQRLGIARALFANPSLLVLDEATSALDIETESDLGEALYRATRHITKIVIAHRLSTVKNADRVVVIEKGQIVASASLRELAKSNKTISRWAKLYSLD